MEVDRDKLLGVVVKKCPPGLAGRLSLPDHILADARLTNINTELESFSLDPAAHPRVGWQGSWYGSDRTSCETAFLSVLPCRTLQVQTTGTLSDARR